MEHQKSKSNKYKLFKLQCKIDKIRIKKLKLYKSQTLFLNVVILLIFITKYIYENAA